MNAWLVKVLTWQNPSSIESLCHILPLQTFLAYLDPSGTLVNTRNTEEASLNTPDNVNVQTVQSKARTRPGNKTLGA